MSNPEPKSTKVVLTREKFDAIPGFRARYIFLYITIFVVWGIATATGFYFEPVEIPIETSPVVEAPETPGEAVETAVEPAQPPAEADSATEAAAEAEAGPAEPLTRTEYRWKWSTPVQIFQGGMMFGMVLFYIYFTRVLTLMGYPLPMILGYCAAVFLPIPGILAVAFVDRQVAKTWNLAEDAFQGRDSTHRNG